MVNLFLLLKTWTEYYVALASSYMHNIFSKKTPLPPVQVKLFMEECDSHVDLNSYVSNGQPSLRRSNQDRLRRQSIFSQRRQSLDPGYSLPPPVEVSDSSDSLHSSNESSSSEKSESSEKGDSRDSSETLDTKASTLPSASETLDANTSKLSPTGETFILAPSIVNFEMNDNYTCDNCEMDSDSKQICEIVRDSRRKTLSPEMFLEDLEKLRNSSFYHEHNLVAVNN